MKIRIRLALLSVCLLITSGAWAQSGYVFLDKNNNGVKDPGEQGIKGVAVSDQVNVAITDDKGFYQLNSPGGFGYLFISMPEAYTSAHGYWQKIDAATPIHPSTPSPSAPAHPPKKVYELFQSEIGKLSTPVWCIPGNHENFGIERQLSLVSKDNPLYGRKMYRHYFGPDYYSFNYGGCHFIGLNSLSFEDLYYYGHIDSTQLEWLKRDLAAIPLSTPVITFQHVPFFSGVLSMSPFKDNGFDRTVEWENGAQQYRHVVSNAEEVVAILNKHNYPLALAGHHHMQQKFIMEGVQTRFEQTAAIIGPSDEGGLDHPSGLTLYRVANGIIDEGHFIHLDK